LITPLLRREKAQETGIENQVKRSAIGSALLESTIPGSQVFPMTRTHFRNPAQLQYSLFLQLSQLLNWRIA
jgi:hypothetical protein